MKIDFTGRHFQLDDEIRSFTEKKLGKLDKFVEDPVHIHVILEVEKHRQIAELHITHRQGLLQATEEAEEMMDAIQAAVDKVEKQARRSRKKLIDKRRRARREDHHWPMEVLEAASVNAGSIPRVVKKGSLPIKPMTIDEASLQLSQSKNDFFVFLDSGTEKVSVLYRRRDNNFGLIAPDF